jgi:sulfite exporter TauE/SafE
MSGAFNLWDPTHSSVAADLLTAFVLGLVHGITPDEHTWPITFSYAIGAYSTWRGFRAGLIFSLAFAVQQAFASELAHFGLAGWIDFEPLHHVVDLVVGVVMIAGGLFVIGRGALPHLHLHLPGTARFAPAEAKARELKPWMPAVHGFIAGWGIDAFSVIVFTTLAPAMPSAATAWLPGFLFGVGTLCVQATAGAAFGFWAARRGLPSEAIRSIALTTAARTLLWGGCAFILFGILGLTFPAVAEFEIPTPLHIPNLETVGLPFFLVIFTVLGVGVTTFISATQAWRRRLDAESAAPLPLKS